MLHLQAQPEMRALAERRAETHGQIEVYVPLFPQEFTENLRADPQVLCELSARQSVVGKNILAQNFAGVRRGRFPSEEVLGGHF